MAAINSTESIEVTPGADPDSVDVNVRRYDGGPIRRRNPADPVYTEAGVDLFLHNDDDDDTVPLTTVILVPDTPNGLHRSASPGGHPTLWAEPSPRKFESASPTDSVLALAAPVGVTDDENAMGVSATATVTNTRELPLFVTAVITARGVFQGRQIVLDRQPPSTVVLTLTGTLTTDGDPPIVAGPSDIKLFMGEGGSTSIVLPAVTLEAGSGSGSYVGGEYELEASLKLVYREDVTETFTVNVDQLQVVLQVSEYSSI